MYSPEAENRIEVVVRLLEYAEQNLQVIQKKLDDVLLRNVLATKKDQFESRLRLDLDHENQYFLKIHGGERKISLPRAIDVASMENILNLDVVGAVREDLVRKYIYTILDNKKLWMGLRMTTLGFSDIENDGVIEDILLSHKEILFMCTNPLSGESCRNYVNPWSLSLGSILKILHRWMVSVSVL